MIVVHGEKYSDAQGYIDKHGHKYFDHITDGLVIKDGRPCRSYKQGRELQDGLASLMRGEPLPILKIGTSSGHNTR
jgi:hypothetical protein